MTALQANFAWRWLLVLASFWLATVAATQTVTPGPRNFKGGWSLGPRSNIWSLNVERVDAEGNFVGQLVYYGIACTTGGLDVNGKWVGGEMTFTARIRTSCGAWYFDLKDGNEHALEGFLSGTNRGGNPKIWLD